MGGLDLVKRLRELTGASIIDCRDALRDAGGDFSLALSILKKKGQTKAEKKSERTVGAGIIDAYLHPGGQVGAMVELRCETDFVAKNEEFRKLAHELCLQIASMSPIWILPEDIPEDILEEEKSRIKKELMELGKSGEVLTRAIQGKLDAYFSQVCLLCQPYIKNQDETVGDLIKTAISKLGENIKVKRFCRFSIKP